MSILVQIQYCKNCGLHSWCSHHDEVKYIDYFEQMSRKILQQIPDAKVIERKPTDNLVPRKNPANDGAMYLNTETGQYVNFPRLGGFEIYVDGARVFSKVKSKVWPKFDNVMDKIKKIAKAKEDGSDIMAFDIDQIAKEEQKSRFTVRNADKYDIRAIFRVRKSSGKNDSEVMNAGERSRHRDARNSLDISRQLNNPEVYETFVQECETDEIKEHGGKQKRPPMNSARKARNVYLQEVYPRNRRKLVISKIDSNRILLQNDKGERIAYRKEVELDQIYHIDRKILESGSSNVRVESRRNNRRKLMPINQSETLKAKINSINENEHQIQTKKEIEKEQDLYDEMKLSQNQIEHIEKSKEHQKQKPKINGQPKKENQKNDKEKNQKDHKKQSQQNIIEKAMQSSQNPKVSKIQQSKQQQEYDGYEDQQFQQSYKAKNSSLVQNIKSNHETKNVSQTQKSQHQSKHQNQPDQQMNEDYEQNFQESKQFNVENEEQQQIEADGQQKKQDEQNKHNPSVQQIDENQDEIVSQKQFQVEQIEQIEPENQQKQSKEAALHQAYNKPIVQKQQQSTIHNKKHKPEQPYTETQNKIQEAQHKENSKIQVKQQKQNKDQVKSIENKQEFNKPDKIQSQIVIKNENTNDHSNDNKTVSKQQEQIDQKKEHKHIQNKQDQQIAKVFEQLTKIQEKQSVLNEKDVKLWKCKYINGQFLLIQQVDQQLLNANKPNVPEVKQPQQPQTIQIQNKQPKVEKAQARNIENRDIKKTDNIDSRVNDKFHNTTNQEKQIVDVQEAKVKNEQQNNTKLHEVEQAKVQEKQQTKSKPSHQKVNWQAVVINGQFHLSNTDQQSQPKQNVNISIDNQTNPQKQQQNSINSQNDKNQENIKSKQQIKADENEVGIERWVAYCKNGQYRLDKQEQQQQQQKQVKKQTKQI